MYFLTDLFMSKVLVNILTENNISSRMDEDSHITLVQQAPPALTNIYFMLYGSNPTNIPWDFALLVFIRWAIAIVGLILNAALFYVTIKCRFLFGTCNFLIGLNAFCAIFSNAFMTIGLVIVLSKIGFVSIECCFWLQCIPMFFGNLFMVSMLAISVDRLLSIIWSIWHKHMNKVIYMTGLLAICFVYSFSMVVLAYYGVLTNKDQMVLCANPGETYQGRIGDILFYLNLLTITLTICCYLLLWLLLRLQKSMTGTFTHKMMKSLFCILAVITLGYFTSVSSKIITRLIQPYVSLSLVQNVYLTLITSMFSMIAKGMNAPILFIFSQDYRGAFRKYFPRVLHSSPITQVSAMNNGGAANAVAFTKTASRHVHQQHAHLQLNQVLPGTITAVGAI